MDVGADVVLQKHPAVFRLPARPLESSLERRPGGDAFFDAGVVLALRTHHQVMLGESGLAGELRGLLPVIREQVGEPRR